MEAAQAHLLGHPKPFFFYNQLSGESHRTAKVGLYS